MMQKIVYGLDTGSIEGADQCVVVNVPNDVDPDELETYLAIHCNEVDGSIVGFHEVHEALKLVLKTEITDAELRSRILDSFTDAVANSY